MKVFISWAGQTSRELGEVFRTWLPGVIQSVKPYFTPDDVEKGTRWATDIAQELEESEVGMMLMTEENLQNPWLMFEAGALSKHLDKSRICPVLFGVENTDLVGPLVQFQTTAFTKDDIHGLVKTINNACGEQQLEDGVLSSVFGMWWPKLEEDVESVLVKRKGKADTTVRSDRDLIEEILLRVRKSGMRVAGDLDAMSKRALRDIVRHYRGLRAAAEGGDLDRIGMAVERLGGPVGYLAGLDGVRQTAWGRAERLKEDIPVEPERISMVDEDVDKED